MSSTVYFLLGFFILLVMGVSLGGYFYYQSINSETETTKPSPKTKSTSLSSPKDVAPPSSEVAPPKPVTLTISGNQGTPQSMVCTVGKLVSASTTWGGKTFKLPSGCVGATTCTVANPTITYGDPTPGVVKTFSSSFVCDNVPGAATYVVTPDPVIPETTPVSPVAPVTPSTQLYMGSEGTPQVMTCPVGKLISSSTNWGGTNFPLPSSCVGATSCIVSVPNTTYGDPAPGVSKIFSGSYICDNVPGAATKVVNPDVCNKAACNAVISNSLKNNWYFNSTQFSECAGCPPRTSYGNNSLV